jgi:amino-acid N-acetyltransferase
MSKALNIRPASPDDLATLLSLLDECQLPSADLTLSSVQNFHVAEAENGEVAGVAGLDKAGSKGVLRSVAVAQRYRGRGVAEQLVRQCETSALIAGVNEVYLLTLTAKNFFRRLGYQVLSREVVPREIAAHQEFQNLCPASAQCLGKRL